jgi:hypothetical protein
MGNGKIKFIRQYQVVNFGDLSLAKIAICC